MARESGSLLGRRGLLVATGGVLAAPAIARAQTAGIALVIGNSKYQWEAQLPNVRRDVPDIVKRFQAMGLKTELLQDVGRDGLRQAIEKFGAAARGANLAAFYFAGHGASWGRDTFLVPVDADLSAPSVVQTLLPTTAVTAAAGEAANRLIVLDACRNNPADGWRQVEAQQSAVINEGARLNNLPPNTLIMFSTSPGRVALDGPAGQNSPFAAALMRQLDAPSVDLRTIPPKLRRDLLIATEGRQVLWDRNSYQGSFEIRGARLPDAANRSSWASDPSKIIDLPNAYAFARDNKFVLPEGLIAHRPAGASPNSQMIGSFTFLSQYKVGKLPQVMIVMSVDDGRSAEIILGGLSELGQYWRFVTGSLATGRLEFVPRANAAKFVFHWRNANSGSLTQFSEGTGNRAPYSADFTRLDG
jgi:hypothetical protein